MGHEISDGMESGSTHRVRNLVSSIIISPVRGQNGRWWERQGMAHLQLLQQLGRFGNISGRGFGDRARHREFVGGIDQKVQLLAKPGHDLLPWFAVLMDSAIALFPVIGAGHRPRCRPSDASRTGGSIYYPAPKIGRNPVRLQRVEPPACRILSPLVGPGRGRDGASGYRPRPTERGR